MRTRIAIINASLAIVFVFFAVNAYRSWTTETALNRYEGRGEGGNTDERLSKSALKKRDTTSMPAAKMDYRNVIQKNLFSIHRTESLPVEKEESVTPAVESKNLRVDGKKIELYGVMMLDKDHISALIRDPESKTRERPTRWIKTGDHVGQYLVTAILAEEIIMSEGSDRFKVVLWDTERKRKQSDTPETKEQPTVVIANSPEEKKPAKQTPAASADNSKSQAGEGVVTIQTPFGNITRKK